MDAKLWQAFVTRHFQRWARKIGISEKALCHAVDEMTQGLIDADLGGGIVKKRIPLAGQGKSGGVRTLIATNKGNRWFFVYGFAKNVRSNINDRELEALQVLAADLLQLTQAQLQQAIQGGSLQDIRNDQQDQH